MTVVERREIILKILEKKGRTTVSDLAAETGFSEVTIRRDIRELEKEGLLIRSRGVVFLPNASRYELSFREREKRMAREKTRIAKRAVEFIEDGMIVGLDAGTTTLYIARQIGERNLKVTVVTPGLPIMQTLSRFDGVKVILLGGSFDPRNLSFVGTLTLRSIEMFEFDVSFIGATNVNPERGIFTSSMEGAEVVRKIAESSQRVIAVFDHTKFSPRSSFLSVEISEIDVVITDSSTPPDILEKFPKTLKVLSV